ncbi:MAG: hypothetical protein AB7P19_01750 [Nitrospira sp.]
MVWRGSRGGIRAPIRKTPDPLYFDQEGRQFLNTCYQKDPHPRTRGYYETEVNKVLYARQPRKDGGGGYDSGDGGKTPYDQEMERQQGVDDSLRDSGFDSRAEACRMDSSKC